MRALLPLSAAMLLSTSTLALAQSFTVSSGQTVTTTQTMGGPSATGTVEAGGTIRTTAGNTDGIDSTGDFASIVNSGLVETTAGTSRGINASGQRTQITNIGTISTAGTFSEAIVASGANGRVDNFGTIVTTRNYGDGIQVNGDDWTVMNRGAISTSASFANPISIVGANGTAINAGTISSTSTGVYMMRVDGSGANIVNSGNLYGNANNVSAIYGAGSDGRIVNSGNVSITGTNSVGIVIDGNKVDVFNSGSIALTGTGVNGISALSGSTGRKISNYGSIYVSGTNAVGIASSGSGDAIINGGSIVAQGSNSRAIHVYANDNILTLLTGSTIQGAIQYAPSAAPSATLNIDAGMSTDLTFTGALPGRINANGALLAVDQTGLRIVSADPAAAGATGAIVDSVIDSAFTALATRPRAGTGAGAVAPLGYAATPAEPEAFAFLDAADELQQPVAWLNGFGGLSRRDLPSGVEMSSHTAGLVAGLEGPVSGTDLVGLMFGGAIGATSAGTASVDASSGFAGIYGTHQFEPFSLDIAVLFGGTQLGSRRSIVDNTVAGGVSTATADYNALFVAPEIGLSSDFQVDGHTITARGALQYAAILMDGYTEQGSTGALTVAPQAAHQVTAKLALAMPFILSSDSETTTRITPRLGLDGTVQLGAGQATGTLAGIPVRFESSAARSVSMSAGMQFEHQVTDRWSVIADGSAAIGTGGQLNGQGGLALEVSF